MPTKIRKKSLILNRRCVHSGYRNGIDVLIGLSLQEGDIVLPNISSFLCKTSNKRREEEVKYCVSFENMVLKKKKVLQEIGPLY